MVWVASIKSIINISSRMTQQSLLTFLVLVFCTLQESLIKLLKPGRCCPRYLQSSFLGVTFAYKHGKSVSLSLVAIHTCECDK